MKIDQHQNYERQLTEHLETRMRAVQHASETKLLWRTHVLTAFDTSGGMKCGMCR